MIKYQKKTIDYQLNVTAFHEMDQCVPMTSEPLNYIQAYLLLKTVIPAVLRTTGKNQIYSLIGTMKLKVSYPKNTTVNYINLPGHS